MTIIATEELQNWAKNYLDKPVELIPDIDPDNPDPDRVFSVPAHEMVDVGGLDVLLNACKPTLLDAKPPIRLNVVQESNPPEALLKNLHRTLGVRIETKIGTSLYNSIIDSGKASTKLLPIGINTQIIF